MRVILPYTQAWLHPRVLPSLWKQGYSVETIECVNRVGHERSYPLILRDALLSGDDVCLIEHDVESRPGFLHELEICPEPWCFFAYDFRVPWEQAISETVATSAPLGVDFAPLGHTRFRGGVGEKIRDLLTSAVFSATWVGRDAFVAPALSEAGVRAHMHPGKAIHHHNYRERNVEDNTSPMGEGPGPLA